MSLDYFINYHFETNRQPTFEDYKKEVQNPKSKYKTDSELEDSYEKMLAKSISVIEGNVKKEMFDYEILSENQKKVFDALVNDLMTRTKQSKFKNPFSLRGLKVKEKSGGSFDGNDVINEARRRLLAINKQKILASVSIESITENVNSIIDNPDLDDADKKQAIDDLMEQAKKNIEKMKDMVEKQITKEEREDLEKSDLGNKFSMASAVVAVLSAMTIEKGNPLDKIKDMTNKLSDVYNDPSFKNAVVNTAALAAAYAALPDGGENTNTVISAITSPTVLKAIKDFGGGAYGNPKQYAGVALLASVLYGIYKYRDSIYKVIGDGLEKPLSMLSYLLDSNASETKKLVLNAYANITNTTVENLNETVYGKFIQQTLEAIPDDKIVADESHEDVKMLIKAFEKLPTNTLLGIESGKINKDNFLNSLNDTKVKQEMITIINSFSNPSMSGITSTAESITEDENLTLPETAPAITDVPIMGVLAPPQTTTLTKINNLNNPVISLPPLPTQTAEINNNYTQNSLPNIMSFQTPYKTYEDLPEYMKVFITREEFNAAMTNEGDINKLILKKQANYVDNKNGLLATRLAKVPTERISVKKGNGYLRTFPVNVPNSSPISHIKPDEQGMIGTNTRLNTTGVKKFVQVEFGKGRKYDNQELIGTETRLIKKVKKIPLY